MAIKKTRVAKAADGTTTTTGSKGIPIEEREVHSVREIVQAFEKEDLLHDSRRELLMRGEDSAQFVPTAGIFRKGVNPLLERKLFDEFRNLIPAHSNIDVRDEWLVLWLAQHHGVPTRLLDWTRSPLVATYFAVERSATQDAAVWVVWGLDAELARPVSPFLVTDIAKVSPIAVTPRVQAQSSVFTVHPDGRSIAGSLKPGDRIQKFVIPAGFRDLFRRQLDFLGVNRSTIFPDLDGLGTWLRWRSQNIV
jgi:hypothetical protein